MAPAPVSRRLQALCAVAVLAGAFATGLGRAAAIPLPDAPATGGAGLDLLAEGGHLVISEVTTGGASASDEFIEIYNPTTVALPLEGLELVYVTASGATVTRKASWDLGATPLEAGAHLLLANEAGIFAAIADATYANGLAAAGGSVALRIQGGASAIDAVGWGTAASSWLETRPAPAPAAGSSLERLPGGPSGSTQDTDDNLLDFTIRPAPDPQNAGSPPVPAPTDTPAPTDSRAPTATPAPTDSPAPTATPAPTDTPAATDTPQPTAALTASPTPTHSPSPTPEPTPGPISIGLARSLPDGTVVTVEGVALTGSQFTEGGGYLADATGGIAVLLADGAFERGTMLRVTGVLDDRYAQRTIRGVAAEVVVLGPGAEPEPTTVATGSVGEALEGDLATVAGTITGFQTQLSGAVAVDIDDGSGSARVVVMDAAGIAVAEWLPGATLSLVAVIGQRDASGTGTTGYRVLPRDAADVLDFGPPPTPTPTPTASPTPDLTPSPEPTPTPQASPTETPTASPSSPLVTITDARSAVTGTRLRIRGVVTVPSGLIDPGSAIVQDGTGAILVRLGDDAGRLSLGQLVEIDGTRSTKSGMLSVRTSVPPVALGTQADPDAVRSATGTLGEALEARLVLVRGAVSTAVTRSSAGSIAFSLDDGTGPIRVHVAPGTGIASGSVVRGSWIEVRGALGQETTGREPARGYRMWPRTTRDLVVVAGPAAAHSDPVGSGESETGPAPAPALAGIVSGWRFDALEGGTGSVDAWTERTVIRPVLARAAPTASPAAQLTTPTARVSGLPTRPRAAGILASGFGLALLAGGIALGGRTVQGFRHAKARAYTPPDLTANARSTEPPPP